jgi:hypothetical protein
MTAAVRSPVAGNRDIDGEALDLVRDRLAGLGRHYTPVDVATAMRAEGLIVSDSAVLDTVESLRDTASAPASWNHCFTSLG